MKSTQRITRGFVVFAIIWAGQLVSLLGSAFTRFGLGIWVYQETGSATQLGLISLFGMLPMVLLSPIAGTLVDRWDRRKTMMLSDTGAGISVLAIVLLLASGQIATWHIYIAVALNSASNAFFWPAYTASMTLLVPKEHLGRANGMMQLAQAAEYIISPVLGAVLLATVQLTGILMIDFITFGIAMLTLIFVRIPNPERISSGQAAQSSIWKDITYGWHYLLARPGLLALMLLWGMAGVLVGMVSVLVTPLVLAFASPAVLGTVMSVGGIGMLVGSVVMSTWGGPKRRIYGVYAFMILEGIGIALAGFQPSAILFGIAVFVFFLGFPIVNGCTQAIMQSKIAPEVQGRVLATSNMIAWASLPVGYLTAGPLADGVFEPLMAVGGPLAGSIGQIIGTGPGRGIGLLFIIAGLLHLIVTAAGALYPRLRLVERELPDAIAERPTEKSSGEKAEPAYAVAPTSS